jgi:hypothetical protein
VGGSGDWNTPSNWSTGSLPGPADDAVIDTSAITVTHSSGSHTVKSLTTANGSFTLSGGTLDITGTLQGNSTFTLSGGTLSEAQVASGTTLRSSTAGGTLDKVTLNGNLDMTGASGTLLDISDGLTLNGTAVLGDSGGSTSGELFFINAGTLGSTSSGTILLGGSYLNGIVVNGLPGTSLTIGPTITIHGKTGGIGTGSFLFTNQGTIRADTAGGTITINGTNWTNTGTLQALNGGSLTLQGTYTVDKPLSLDGNGILRLEGTWTNYSTISANGGELDLGTFNINFIGSWSNKGTITVAQTRVYLDANFTTADVGNFNRSGGIVYMMGRLDNTGATLTLNQATGSWLLLNGIIVGGTINEAGASLVPYSNGTLFGVIFDGDLDGTNYNGGYVHISGGLTLNGTAYLGNTFGTTSNYLDFYVGGSQTLDSQTGATIVFGPNPNNAIRANFGPVTFGPKVTVRGHSGDFSLSNGSLMNRGVIEADVPGGTMSFTDGSVTNDGTIAVDAGSTLSFIHQTLANNGTLIVSQGTLNLGAAFTTAGIGTFQRDGGTVNLTGYLTNTDATFTLNAATGSWNFKGGAIIGGTVVETDGAALVPTTAGGTLDGITLDGDLDVTGSTTHVTLADGLTLNGTLYLGNSNNTDFGYVTVQYTQTLTSTTRGTIRFEGDGEMNLVGFMGVQLTLGPRITVRGSGGLISSGNYAIDNQGTIMADVPGLPLALDGSGWTNSGTVAARNGGVLYATAGFTNFADGTLTGGNWLVADGSTLTIVNGTVTTNAATIVLAGPDSQFNSAAGVDALANFVNNSSTGTFNLRDGRGLTVGVFSNAGKVAIGPGSAFATNGDYTQTGGTMLLDGGSLTAAGTVQIQGGILLGSGTINADVVNAGQIMPGTPGAPGVLTIAGNYTQTGELVIEIGGTTAGVDYGQLNIGGQATFAGGTLTVGLINGFVPDPSNPDSFRILTFGFHEFRRLRGLQRSRSRRRPELAAGLRRG